MVDRWLLGGGGARILVAVAIAASGGLVFDLGALHVSALHARNPMSIAGVLLLVWAVSRVRLVARP